LVEERRLKLARDGRGSRGLSAARRLAGRAPTSTHFRHPRNAVRDNARISTKYTGGPYPRGEERVVALIEPDRQSVG